MGGQDGTDEADGPRNMAFETPAASAVDRREYMRRVAKAGLAAGAVAALPGLIPLASRADAIPAVASKRPNVILILSDDLGFSDLGAMGSEVRTPNIDSIATNGTMFTAMYNAARCCPTRATLLTGLYSHKAGVGQMGANLGTPAYQGHLRNDTVTIAEALRPAGYRTLMSGKWHVGGEFWPREADNWKVGDFEHPTPRQRGFDRFYGTIDGASSYFSPWYVMENDNRVHVPPTDYYITDVITDKAIGMIEESVHDEKPFFLYLAYTAPHWPLHAHDQDIAKYDQAYRGGWDKIREARFEEMRHRNILQHKWDLSPRNEAAPAWQSVANQDWEAQRMAVYAAMIDRMDQQIGRVMETLKRLGQYDDTLILFMSDNGGCAEVMRDDGWSKFYPDKTNDGKAVRKGNIPNLRPGDETTFMSYDLPWANVSNTPFRMFKHWVHEGGISTPLFVQWPARLKKQGVSHTPCHAIDILPTILEATGVSYPHDIDGHAVQAFDGESLMQALGGKPWLRENPIFWEHEGNSAMRHGNLKIVRKFNAPWELYDMENDRTELHDLSARNKPVLDKMAADYGRWAHGVGVEDWNVLEQRLKDIWRMADITG